MQIQKNDLREELKQYIGQYIRQNITENVFDTSEIRFSFTDSSFECRQFEDKLRQHLLDQPETESFSDKVNRIIYEKNFKTSSIYTKLGMDRRHFSKIRLNQSYQPSRRTAILLAFALELKLDEANDLLKSAGFSLSHADKRDIIIEYFLKHQIYDLMLLNEMLADFDLPLLLKCD